MFDFLRRLWSLTGPYRFRLILGIALGVVAGTMEAAVVAAVYLVFAVIFPESGGEEIRQSLDRLASFLPALAQRLESSLASLNARPEPWLVILVVSLIPLVMLVRGVVGYLHAYLLNWVAVRTLADFRARLLLHLLHLPIRTLQRFGTGELMSRLTADVGALHNALAGSFVSLVKDPVAVLAFLAWLLGQFGSLTLTALVVFPVCVVPVAIYARKLRKATEGLQSDAAEVSQCLHDALSGASLVKAYNLEPVMVARLQSRLDGYNRQWMRATRASELPGPLIELGGSIGMAFLLGSIALAQSPGASAAGFLSFILAVILLYQRIRSLIKLQNLLIQGRAASARVFELLATPSDIPDPALPKPLPPPPVDIHFDHVDFAYHDKAALHDIHLTLPAGKMVALVGPSGAGKSTIAHLLLRFHDPSQGRVLWGDIDLRDLSLLHLRNHIAVVSQDVVLFHDTIRHNLELGRPGASLDEIQEAARHAHAHEFILQKPLGYDTIVGERGSALSGGQRQRLAIARALLRNAPVLILDEATSALDTESERLVQAALETLMRGRTTLCIAHRLSTIQRADLIVVLDAGRIVAQGRHEQLLQQPGLYRRLHDLQNASEA